MLGETSLRTSRYCGRHLCLQLVYKMQMLPPGVDGLKGKQGKEKTDCTLTLRETEELVREPEGSQRVPEHSLLVVGPRAESFKDKRGQRR